MKNKDEVLKECKKYKEMREFNEKFTEVLNKYIPGLINTCVLEDIFTRISMHLNELIIIELKRNLSEEEFIDRAKEIISNHSTDFINEIKDISKNIYLRIDKIESNYNYFNELYKIDKQSIINLTYELKRHLESQLTANDCENILKEQDNELRFDKLEFKINELETRLRILEKKESPHISVKSFCEYKNDR